MIIDGMDQSHCVVPYLGRQDSLSDPLGLSLTGVKIHGLGATLYRTLGTVSKGANLSIYCILSELEKWKLRYRRYPDELFVQVDGGSENANKYFLSMLELLVVKRICRLVYYTRLPTGHTHSDIDALFGVIWKSCRPSSYETLEIHREKIKKSFPNFDIEVEDVYICPDYSKYLEPSIDPHFRGMHKGKHTQHQWRFEAVKVCTLFKFGCKTTYRAYSSDNVSVNLCVDRYVFV